MLVVIDGADFSGKSTIISLLEESLIKKGYQVHKSRTSLSGGVFANIVEYAQRETTRPIVKYFTFHLAYLIDFFSNKQDDNIIFLQETYWSRVHAYDVNYKRVWGIFFFFLFKKFIIQPDISFFLHANANIRFERYKKSGSQDQRDYYRFSSLGFKKYNRLIATYRLLCSRQGYMLFFNNSDNPNILSNQMLEIVESKYVKNHI
ncbi:hypothetical protein MKL42_01335 [Acinetobacter sp. AOR15_HL]|uniref:hypothetical protein n=1 Tax=unclassified Acinetobacter TaxID=196816 RepID=UPI0022EADF02|nr:MULTISPECIES: hypothetical protein [unclassified Acinetobacter]MDA3556163.1 hypothetical protein [Acinetobacter sp. AOR15_HL]MDA3571620.1 hypothetical protein [Acinetobacter sp. AOR14_HL]